VIYLFDTREYRKLTDSGFYPRWLNDSRRMVYSHGDDTIHIVDRETGEDRELLSALPDTVNDVFPSPASSISFEASRSPTSGSSP
jgi:hypothetical protein